MFLIFSFPLFELVPLHNFLNLNTILIISTVFWHVLPSPYTWKVQPLQCNSRKCFELSFLLFHMLLSAPRLLFSFFYMINWVLVPLNLHPQINNFLVLTLSAFNCHFFSPAFLNIVVLEFSAFGSSFLLFRNCSRLFMVFNSCLYMPANNFKPSHNYHPVSLFLSFLKCIFHLLYIYCE